MGNVIYAEELFQENCRKAEEMLNHPDKVDKLLKRLEKKLQGMPTLGKELACIPQLGMLINSFIKRQYTDIPTGLVIIAIGVVLYFVLPFDIIPDFIPGIGHLDDATVAMAAMYLIKNDLDEYMKWRVEKGLDKPETIAG